MLKGLDIIFSPFFACLINRFLSAEAGINRLLVVGGGPSRTDMSSSLSAKDTRTALLNYTKGSEKWNVDYLLLSDHFVFSLKNSFRTLQHIKKVKPKYIFLPTRAFYSPLGFFLALRGSAVFLRYYGKPMWQESSPPELSLSHELLSFDTVAFEFGFPLASSLNVSEVVFMGVDLSYGEEDKSAFRVQWRRNIEKSVDLVLPSLPFSVFKTRECSFGEFNVFRI